MTEESYRPRVSDRTMVGNSATVTLASFANRRATVSTETMEPQGEEHFAASRDGAKDDRKSERVGVQLGAGCRDQETSGTELKDSYCS